MRQFKIGVSQFSFGDGPKLGFQSLEKIKGLAHVEGFFGWYSLVHINGEKKQGFQDPDTFGRGGFQIIKSEANEMVFGEEMDSSC